MRLLRRNTTVFEYLANTGVDSDVNENMEHTGVYHHEYASPVECRGNISMPTGQTTWEFYGLEGRYTHTLVMDKPDVDIHEGGIIRWKGHTYDILAVRPSLNVVAIALRQQTEDHALDLPGPEPDWPTGVTGVTGVTGATGATGETGGEAP